MPGPLSPWPIELRRLDTGTATKLLAVADPDHPDTDDDQGYTGEFVALDMTRTLTSRDVPVDITSFRRGAFFVRRHGEADDGGYAWAENGFTHYDSGFSPSGLRSEGQAWPNVSGSRPTTMVVTDSKIFAGHLWCITNGTLVIRYPLADPTATPVYDPALGFFGVANVCFHSGYLATAMCVFGALKAGTIVPALYVFTYNPAANLGAGGTLVYEYTTVSGWQATATPFTTFRVDKATTVWWEGANGTGAQRMVVAVTPLPNTSGGISNTLMHCILGQDPKVQTSYVAPIVVGNPGYPITALVAAPQHAIPIKSNGIHDFNEIRSMNLTPAWETTVSYNVASAAQLLDGQLYVARGFGLSRMPLSELGQVHDGVMECGPGYGGQDGTPIRGQITALAVHNSDLLMALFNHETRTTYIGRAVPKSRFATDPTPNLTLGVNPLLHYWAEQVIPPSNISGTLTGQIVTHMTVVSPTPAASSTTPSRSLYLVMFVADYPTTGAYNFRVYSCPLPIGSGPTSLLASTYPTTTAFPTNPSSWLYFTAQQWGDDIARKYVRVIEVRSQNMSGGNVFQLSAAADTNPAQILDASAWTALGSLTEGTALAGRIVPDPMFSGRSIMLRAFMTNANTLLYPSLQAISPRAKVVRQTSQVRTIWVVLQKHHKTTGDSGVDIHTHDDVWDQIVAMQDMGKVAFRDERSTQTSNAVPVLIEQGISYRRARVTINGRAVWRTVARLTLSEVT